MGKPMDPGPPLKPGEEYCEFDPPTGTEQAKGIGMAILALLAGTTGALIIAATTGRQLAITAVLLGTATGWVVNWAANRHRSLLLGISAAASTFFTSVIAYALLWLPLEVFRKVDKQLTWYDLVMVGLSAFVAYRLAGPRAETNHLR